MDKLLKETIMGNNFFFLNKYSKYWTKSSLKIDNIYNIGLKKKAAFITDFGPWEVPQPKTAWMWKYMFSRLGTSLSPKSIRNKVFL